MTAHRDPYCYDGSTVLKNLADCRTQHDLDAFEGQMVAFNLVAIATSPITLPFGPGRLRETHRRIFEGVYDWAGDLRADTGRITKQRDGYQVTYADSTYVVPELAKIFDSLSADGYLKQLDQRTFTTKVAHLYGELDAVHPFREGNSRTLRQFTSDLAMQAGFELDWSRLPADREARARLYFARDLAVVNADSKALAAIIEPVIAPIQGRHHEPRSGFMKHRVLVMNGQRIVQSEQPPSDASGQPTWRNDRVDKANGLKPGIYNISLAVPADRKATTEGAIVHVDKASVFQQVGKQFVVHERSSFDKSPEIGASRSISYNQTTGRAVVAAVGQHQGRGLSR